MISFAVICGRNTYLQFKQAAEIGNILVTAIIRNSGYGHICGLQQMAGVCDAHLGDGLAGRDAEMFPEQFSVAAFRKTLPLCQIGNG